MVLVPTTELATQKSVSLPMIVAYVNRVERGERYLEIQLQDNYILNGHHRFIVAKLCNIQPIIQDGTVTNYHQSVAYPVKNIVIDPVDWGYR